MGMVLPNPVMTHRDTAGKGLIVIHGTVKDWCLSKRMKRGKDSMVSLHSPP